ncbi:MAG: tannase/feruloyl esterase family alpha/beta hydrolase [Rhodobacteraceae bacterium]|nr:tannase/feruloyl esterase family alpha/beta hydrolase [Paracoccaceae bacterium]
MAAMAAQRYPDLYDGILSGAPVIDLTRNGGLYGSWIVQKNTDSNSDVVLGPKFNAKLPALHAEVLRQCDTDNAGVVTDPRTCKFDAAALPRCENNEDSPACFTESEAGVIAAWYGGPRNSAGNPLYFGTPPGSEPFWPVWLTGTDKSRAVGMDLGRDYLKMAFSPSDPGPALTPDEFDFDRDPPRLASRSAALNATDPNLSAFAKSGGKMIMYQGWADPVVLPQRTVEYYESAVAQNGGLAKTQEFFRLFMIAGIGHCWEVPAPAPDQFDPIAALEAWAERGVAPEAIPIVQRDKAGKAVRKGTLRPFPLTETFDPAVVEH